MQSAAMTCAAVGPIRLVATSPVKRSARVALGVAALALASGLQAGDLFLPVDPGSVAAAVAPATASVRGRPSASVVPDVWERRVRVVRDELTAARDGVESAGTGRLLLNVRDGVRLDVVVERTAPTKWGYSLSGRVAGGGVGFVTLVVHDEAVAGSIWTPDAAYELNYLGGGVHALRDVTNTPLQCGGALPSELSAEEAVTQGGKDDGSLVDILVVWTLEAAEEYGDGEPQLLSRIDMLIAFANDAFDRSGVFVSLNLVGAEELEYSEADTGDWLDDTRTDIDRLVYPDDGHMDRVHDLRNSLGADLVYLLTRRSSGYAEFGRGFAVGGASGFTLAHEVGHNFNLSHERYLSPGGYDGYGKGFTTERCHRSIMSYGQECFFVRGNLPFYASPWRYGPGNGRPLGVARFSKERGVRGPADAVLTLNRNRHRVANLRPSRSRE